ncbi:NAD(P)H-dependent oxidoreductase [Ottowia thiooxydans]|uniref:NAD(P)H-dependent oxidoreductase n=1 Tax=Ottowia thiooxydans TaxID=219182 RepID=UPI003398BD41
MGEPVPRRVLLVSAHPEPRSFHAALRATAVEELESQGCIVTVSDLYAMRFKATVDHSDFPAPDTHEPLNVSLAQRRSWKDGSLAADIQTELNHLLEADLLLLMFPLWWFGMPAILKGWIDRVFLSGVVYSRSAVFELGRLAGKTALVAVTTGAPSQAYGPNSLNGEMNDILMPLQRGVLGFTGMQVLPPFVGYQVPYVGDEGRADILAEWRLYLRGMNDLVPLVMPRLADHGDALGVGVRAN